MKTNIIKAIKGGNSEYYEKAQKHVECANAYGHKHR